VLKPSLRANGSRDARPMTGSTKQSISPRKERMDCFVAALLAMTGPRCSLSPLPLWERSDRIDRCDPGEGLRTIDRPEPLTPTLSHKGRGGAPPPVQVLDSIFNSLSSNTPSRSRGAVRPSFALKFPPSKAEGAGNAGRRCARSRAWWVGSTRVSHHGHTGITRHSPRNGFNGFLRALPGDRACLPPSSLRSVSFSRT
jgi:hypothetical protein